MKIKLTIANTLGLVGRVLLPVADRLLAPQPKWLRHHHKWKTVAADGHGWSIYECKGCGARDLGYSR